MSLLLNDEQRQLRESAQEFLAARAPVAAQRALRDRDDALGFDPALWQEIVGLGWTGAAFPEAQGGFAFGWQSLGSIFEYAGRNLSALPLLSSVVLGGGLVLEAGDEAQRQRWLPSVMDGSARFALALEEAGRHDPQAVLTTARRGGDGWLLDGDKWFVIDGVGAEHLIVVARIEADAASGDEIGLFVVDAAAAGVTVERLRMVDSRNAAHVVLRDAKVGDDARLAGVSDVAGALELVLDRARVYLAAEALGLVHEAFDRTLAYLKERVQFGVPIGSFQALQHRAARLFCDIELLESCVAAALEALDGDGAELPQLASLAKARASQLCEKVLNEAVQLHEGIGVTDEFDMGLFMKRARIIQQSFGDGAFHRERYARLRGF